MPGPLHISRSLALGLSALALSAPAALAAQSDPAAPAGMDRVLWGALDPDAQARVAPVRSADEGFDWGSAAIGAGAAVGGMLLVGAGGLGAAHRARVRPAR